FLKSTLSTPVQSALLPSYITSSYMRHLFFVFSFFFNDPATTGIYTLSLHDALPILVAEASERVVGFMVYELHKHRLHVLNFAVSERFRRRAVGSQMAKKLVSKLSYDRRSRIMLEVRETNLPAQLFFRSVGFRAVSV